MSNSYTSAERIFLDLMDKALATARERGEDFGRAFDGEDYYYGPDTFEDEYDLLRKLKESGVRLKDVGETDD